MTPPAFELGTDGPLSIVVGIDGTPTSLRAASYAAGLARRQHARLIAVFVASTPGLAGMAPATAALMQDSVEQLAADLRRQVLEGAASVGIAVDFVTAHGDPFTELVRVATEVRADAVVVGASARVGHRVVGALGVRLVRAGRWPITVVP